MLHNETLGKRCIQLSITSTQLPHTRRFLSALQHYFYPYSGLVAAIVSPSFALAILLHTPPIFLLFALAQRGIEGLEDFKYVNPFSYALIGLIGNESEGAGEFRASNGDTVSLNEERNNTEPALLMNGLGLWENFSVLLTMTLITRAGAYYLLVRFHDAGRLVKKK
mmetsp:Transcript_4726/g.7275  ORF Transcript_4726/g.7275 Transcript_4726/m.7275 type:complete len:166 (+) Transcript_4726:139-636(+)